MKYILIGTPSVGKSTLGEKAAAELGLPFYDTDRIAVERVQPRSRLDVFRSWYTEKLIDEQINAIFELAQKDEDAIISTGAALPTDGGCAGILPKLGVVIHIKRDINSAREDAKNNSGCWVSLDENKKPIPGSEIFMGEKAVDLYECDLPIHESIANYTIENDGEISGGVEKLVALIKSLKETATKSAHDD